MKTVEEKALKAAYLILFLKFTKTVQLLIFFYELSTSNLKAKGILLCTRYTLGQNNTLPYLRPMADHTVYLCG